MITGCCACPARSAALISKGFGAWEAARNSFITLARFWGFFHAGNASPQMNTDFHRLGLSPKASVFICVNLWLKNDGKKAWKRSSALLFDHDCPGHLRVNGAKIGVSTGSARCDRELLIGVERGRFLKLLLHAHNRVRFFVAIDPGDLISRF